MDDDRNPNDTWPELEAAGIAPVTGCLLIIFAGIMAVLNFFFPIQRK